MAYIGKSPQTGAYSILDSLTASATASYTMQLNSVNYIPESAQHLILSLNGTIQKPGSSFTVSGSTLTFSEALTSSDSIDFIYALGNVLDIGTPSDATVTNAKTNFVSTSSNAGLQIKGDNTTAGTLQLNCEQNSHGIKLKSPPHSASASYTLTFPNDDGDASEFLQTNGSGVLTWASAGGSNTPYFNGQKASQQTITRNTMTTVTGFTTGEIDSDSAFDGTTFTVPSGKNGVYFFSASIISDFQSVGNDGERFLVAFRKNNSNSNVPENDFAKASGYNITRFTSTITAVLSMSVGDTMEVSVYNKDGDASGNAFVSTNSFFMGYKIIT